MNSTTNKKTNKKTMTTESVILSSKAAKKISKEIVTDERDVSRGHRINVWGVCSCGQTFHDDED